MKYSPVFTIEIEHDYFTVTKPGLLRIVPTRATERIMNGAGLIAKFFQNKLYVLVRHLDATTPQLQLANDFKLQFFLEVIGYDFTRVTNYKTTDPYNTKLFFSNTNSILDGSDKEIENELYLHEKLPQFNAANEYRYNDLVRSGSDTAYECLVKVDAGTGNLNNGAQFRTLEKVSYVTEATSLVFTGAEKTMPLQVPSTGVDIKYFQYDPSTQLFDKEVKNTIIGPAENPQNELITNVPLKFYDEGNIPFSEGIYRVTLNTQEEFLYFRLTNDYQPYLGLINIHNDAMATEAKYRFLQEDGSFYTVAPDHIEIETRNYKIRFAPAQYLLKYVCKTNTVTDISDDDGTIEFIKLPVAGTEFQSRFPVRMNEKPIDTITVSLSGSDDLQHTRIPGYSDLSVTTDANKYIVSETFLNL
ncbi:hypothetical protein [Pareuzebyella sediminis]|uniref:hypothetical protein n=1 Tax=Pareuzebyella sediminis TaxID=2607998 RepID=UPI0011EDF6B4|nr:hypothetical protein [Pareuzebyella sediminis]